MASTPDIPLRPASTRVRVSARPKSAIAAPLAERSTPTNVSSEPPRKRRKYIPGGPGGGGRYLDDQGNEVPVGGTGPGGYNYIGDRGPIGRDNAARGIVPTVYNRRDRSERTRTVAPRSQPPQMRFTSAAQAAAVVQSDGYKPREERAWEEFHPEMDIEAPLRAFSVHEVEGTEESRPVTPVGQSVDGSSVGMRTPGGLESAKTTGEDIPTPAASQNGDSSMMMSIPGTPGGGKRKPGRPPKDPVKWFAAKAAKLGKGLNIDNINITPRTPKILPPIQNMNAKERLTLPQPSYRKTDTLARFEVKSLGLVRYVDKSMANVGYQESDIFIRPDRKLIKVSDAILDDDLDIASGHKSDGEVVVAMSGGGVGRVEYDMDEQDDKWLQQYNSDRKLEPITREVFEITITKIEKEWHLLEKRIPKPNPKPPQTQRPRSSSAAAVNGEPQAGEEQDSKCAICDDGDCENTNAIVFCDGCDLAVHQECYGVPFIPEGQWMCRKCLLIGRGVPTCIFCPNTDGAFKLTNASKWAHLLCAMWIPEVSLGNHAFMEPVMDVEKVPKNRWNLQCYICQQKMGACIQCGNTRCYEAFHVTCARRARLFLKMKNDHGTLAVIDGTTVLKAFCDQHGPEDYSQENNVAEAIKEAKSFYARTMRGRLWANSQASATALAATHHHAITEHQPNESQLTGAKINSMSASEKKKSNQPQKPVWKLPSGAPVIPLYVFNNVEKSLQRFNIHKRKEYAADACKYWTLKREARRGAALLKRLQLQMETFSSMEITRRNWAGMGQDGRPRLARRIEFAQALLHDLEKLKSLSGDVLARENEKMKAVDLEEDLVDTVYFPVAKLLPPIVEKALALDIRSAFTDGLLEMQNRLEMRFYTSSMTFVQDFSDVFRVGIVTEPVPKPETAVTRELEKSSPTKKVATDIKERRRLAKRIIKAVQPQLDAAVRAEADITSRSANELLHQVEQLLESSLESKELISVTDATSMSHLDNDHEQEVEPEVEPEVEAVVQQVVAQAIEQEVQMELDEVVQTEIEQENQQEVEREIEQEVEQEVEQETEQVVEDDLVLPDLPNEPDAVPDNNDADTGSELTDMPEGLEAFESNDVDMDMDAPGEEVDENELPVITLSRFQGVQDVHMSSSSALSELHTSPSKSDNVHMLKDISPPRTNGHVAASSKDEPPTPPISNGETNVEIAETNLSQGGIPWYLKEYEPDGTTVSDPVESGSGSGGIGVKSQEGGDNEEEAVEATTAVSAPAKPKKGKAKKKARSRR